MTKKDKILTKISQIIVETGKGWLNKKKKND